MNYRGYDKDVVKLNEQLNLTSTKRYEWLQRTLFLSATLFGILISLQANAEPEHRTHWALAISLVALALGILTLAIASYGQINGLKRLLNKQNEELKSAALSHRDVEPVFSSPATFYTICEAAAYIFLLLSVLLLATYAVMVAL